MSGFFAISDDTSLVPWQGANPEWTAPKIAIFEDARPKRVEEDVNAFLARKDISICAIGASAPSPYTWIEGHPTLATWHVVTVIYQERRS